MVDVSGLSSHNDGSRYFLTCIDVFSKRAWAVPVRRKAGENVAEAFEKILADGNRNMLQSDKVTEFLNSTFQSMLRRRGIKFYTCLLYTSPSPRDRTRSRMPSSA